MFIPYYFLAVGFGVLATIVSLYGLKNAGKSDDKDGFPGKLSGPLMFFFAVIGIATVTAVWLGGNKEVKERKAEQKEHAESKAGASVLPSSAIPSSVVLSAKYKA